MLNRLYKGFCWAHTVKGSDFIDNYLNFIFSMSHVLVFIKSLCYLFYCAVFFFVFFLNTSPKTHY